MKFSMRISNEMKEYFSEEAERLIPGARVYLFGSRVHDQKRGGDIDIMILAGRRLELEELSRIRVGFWKKFGEQKIDLVSYTFDENDLFKELIMEQAVEI